MYLYEEEMKGARRPSVRNLPPEKEYASFLQRKCVSCIEQMAEPVGEPAESRQGNRGQDLFIRRAPRENKTLLRTLHQQREPAKL
jgi:hypothetical protein